MTIFENIKSKNIDELVNWIDKNFAFDTAPYMRWFDNEYCSKCKPEMVRYTDDSREMEYAWCELNERCRFFQHMNYTPSTKQIIKMWLESEVS